MKTKISVSETWKRKDDPSFSVRVIKTGPLVVHVQNLDGWKTSVYTNEAFARLFTKQI